MLRLKAAVQQFLSKRAVLVFGIFLLAFIVRFVYLNQLMSSPDFDRPQADALWHHTWAKEISSGDWIGKEVFFKAPLYPYFLGTLYAIFGDNFYLPRLIQIIMGSLSCVLIFFLAGRAFNRTVGIIASIVACLYAPFIHFDAELELPVLEVLLDLLLFLSLLVAGHKLKKRWWLLAGALLGLSAITRPNILVFVPFVLLWMYLLFWKENKNKVFMWVLSYLLGAILIISTVTVRNWLVEKDFVPISSQGGINFFIGNNKLSDGKTAFAYPGMAPYQGYKDNIWITSVKLAEKNLGRKLKPSQISNFWLGQSLDFIKGYPLGYLKLLGKKFYFFWNSYEIESNKDLYFYSRWSSILRLLLKDWAVRFPFGIIGPLSILGVILSVRFWRKHFLMYAFVASYMFSVVLFFVTSRFRLPVIPFLIIFGSYCVYWLAEKVKQRKTMSLIIFFLVLIPLLLISNSNLFGVNQPNFFRTYNILGLIYTQKGWYDSAISMFQESTKINPLSAMPHLHLGKIYYKRGNWEEAINEYQLAINLNPTGADAYNDLGHIYDSLGQENEALLAYQKAVQMDSTMVRTYVNLAFLNEKKGLYQQAVDQYRKALAFEPGVASLHNNLGGAYVKLGLKDQAFAEFKKASELDPKYVPAHINLGNSCLEKGQHKEAIAQYETAIRLDPKTVMAYRNLAIIYLNTNQPDKAIQVLTRGLQVNSNAEDLKRLLVGAFAQP